MSAIKHYTFEEKQQIENYLKQGKSIYSIAKSINRSSNGLSYEIRRNGGTENYSAEQSHKKLILNNSEPQDGAKHLAYWERETIQNKIEEGLSSCSIAKFLCRSSSGICYEIRKNGGRGNYNAQLAQEFYENKQSNKSKVSASYLKNSWKRSEAMELNIETLKMQVDILFDMIKKLQKEKG